MRKSEKNFLAYIQTLPAQARQDLLQFIESSTETAVSDEGAYLRDVIQLHAESKERAPHHGAGQRGGERPC